MSNTQGIIALPQSVVMLKKAIKRLAARGVIELPPSVGINTATKPAEVFVFSGDKAKRDSLIVVALTVTGGCNLTSTSDGS